jgi:hypothetical protein
MSKYGIFNYVQHRIIQEIAKNRQNSWFFRDFKLME